MITWAAALGRAPLLLGDRGEAVKARGVIMRHGGPRSAARVSQHVLLLLAEAGDAEAQCVARL